MSPQRGGHWPNCLGTVLIFVLILGGAIAMGALHFIA
jgi:hypothetical protein